MKAFNVVVKVLVALAAVAGAVYVIATYGEKIVAWAKDMLNRFGACDCDCCCDCECEDDCECECEGECKCCCAEEAPAEEAPVEEAPAEEAAPVEEAPVVEENAVVADDADFEG